MTSYDKPPPDSEITPHATYLRRREFLKNSLLAATTGTGVGASLLWLTKGARSGGGLKPSSGAGATPLAGPSGSGFEPGDPWSDIRKSPFSVTEPRTSFEDVTGYNNFYEFGLDKGDPARNAAHASRRGRGRSTIEGEVAEAADRRHRPAPRLVPARGARLPHALRRGAGRWSIPWLGFPLADLLKRVEPTSRAKYVAFTTLLDPEQMPGQQRRVLDWPYVEGLRIDEAMHPLTLLAVGLYGKALPEPERRAAAAGRAVEVRLQGHQVDRQDPPHRGAAADDLEPAPRPTSTASTPT